MIRNERPESSWNNTLAPDYQAGDARSIILSTHHFETWDDFVAHIETLRDGRSPVARYEAAVDAIVEGDFAKLATLLRDDPALIRARSTRRHDATLLHYVGANGVEGFRQHTPRNAVEIARLLLGSDDTRGNLDLLVRGRLHRGRVEEEWPPCFDEYGRVGWGPAALRDAFRGSSNDARQRLRPPALGIHSP